MRTVQVRCCVTLAFLAIQVRGTTRVANAQARGSLPMSRHTSPGRPIRHASHTMWMSQPHSQVCVVASFTPYRTDSGRREYPTGYHPGAESRCTSSRSP